MGLDNIDAFLGGLMDYLYDTILAHPLVSGMLLVWILGLSILAWMAYTAPQGPDDGRP